MSDDIELPQNWESFGPKVRALATDRQRAFVFFYVMNGGQQGRAAASAGYSLAGDAHSAGTQASRLLQRQDILDALEEMTWRKLHGMAAQAVGGLEAMIRDPRSKGHAKAVEMVLERTGFVAERRVKIEDNRQDGDAVAQKLLALCEKLGIDPKQLLGPMAMKVFSTVDAKANAVDAKVVEVTPPKKAKGRPKALPAPKAEDDGTEGLEDML